MWDHVHVLTDPKQPTCKFKKKKETGVIAKEFWMGRDREWPSGRRGLPT
jgi:hypothetical protein